MTLIVRPITEDGDTGFDKFGQLVCCRRDPGGFQNYFFINDVRGKACLICNRGWEVTSASLGDQTEWRVVEAIVHKTCLIRHLGLRERESYLAALVKAHVRFSGLEAIPNQYWAAPDPWAAKPWYTTRLLDHNITIIIGFRKHVTEIAIQPNGGTLPKDFYESAEKDFAAEKVTKSFGPQEISVHAWNDAKVSDYLTRLMRIGRYAEPIAPNESPADGVSFELCGCGESIAYREHIKTTARWLHELGADGSIKGPMNGDEGAEEILDKGNTLLKHREA